MDEASQTIYFIGPDWKAADSRTHWRLDCVSPAVRAKFDKQIREEMGHGGARDFRMRF